ncbi:MAG: YciI family protein [Gaiellaceae bacterium]
MSIPNDPVRRTLDNDIEEVLSMQYALLIYDDEKVRAGMSEDERNDLFGEYGAFTTELRASGGFVDGAPLQPTSTATAVRIRDGEQVVTDGPFAETKEQLGGGYVVEAPSLDEALTWAAKIPSARYGTDEVRPVRAKDGAA